MPYEAPTEDDYLNYLSAAPLPPERERYVRIRAWWYANDPLRAATDIQGRPLCFSDRQLANLDRLASLLNETDPEDRLLKAEIGRERGHFEEALTLLECPFPEDCGKAVEIVKALCHQRITAVAVLGDDVLGDDGYFLYFSRGRIFPVMGEVFDFF